MSTLGAARRRARWETWVRATRLRLHRWDIELVVETEGTPTFDTPPVVELSRQGQVSMTRRPGVRRLTLRLAPGVHLGRGLVLELRPEGDHLLEMDNDAYFLSAVRLVLLDGEISLGRATRVRDGAVVRCSGRLTTGALSGINNYAIVHCANRVRLGEGSHITDRVTVVDSDHAHDGSDEWHMLQPTLIGEVEIGDNTLVGANAVILRDARVGANSIVAAGSVVVGGDYPDSSLLAGVPATVVRELRTEDQPA